jgi:hypothetical protein
MERDLRDNQREKEGDRQELVDTIREQEKDLDFYQGVLSMLLTKGEIYKVKEKVEFDFERNKWIVPPFILKGKEVSFPKISNAMNLVEQSLNERELQFNEADGKKLSFERPSASVVTTTKQMIPRNQISFMTDSASPDKTKISPF